MHPYYILRPPDRRGLGSGKTKNPFYPPPLEKNGNFPKTWADQGSTLWVYHYAQKHGQIKETPYGYTIMPKKHGQIKERSDYMAWILDDSRPIYLQIVDVIKTNIIAGAYQPGDKLPSVRDLAMEASVNPNTMQKALTELERSGLVYTQRTSGRFITEDTAKMTEIKEQLAREQIQLFLKNMEQLGFKKEDIKRLLDQELKGGQ